MKVLAYNPESDLFFIGASFDEFSRIQSRHTVYNTGSSLEIAKQLMQEETASVLAGEGSFYFDLIKDCYGIDVVPDICFSVCNDLSVLEVMEHDFPFGHMWNGYSPWKEIHIVDIDDLNELKEIRRKENL